MADVVLLLPDLLLIVAGWLICRFTPLGRPVWDGAERLVYHVLFPTLLFTSILRSPQPAATLLPLVAAGLGVSLAGIALALPLARLPGVDGRLHASGAQVAYRFNTFVALALSERLAGSAGLAWTALIVAVCVPVVNVAAVWPLARQGGRGLARELARNPLIVATLAGLLCNAVGLRLPEVVLAAAGRVGSAALPVGLMAVGAGLQLGALREGPRLAALLIAIRHALLPAAGIALAWLLALPPAQQAVLVVFASVPAASSAYVLAVRMGGHGPFVAGLVTLSTLVALPGLPLALTAWRWTTSLAGH
ncbi:MAG: AEC family transporter [Rubrivivax sp.]